MRFSNGVVAVALALGTLTLPSLAGTKTVGGEKSGCSVSQKPVAVGNCAVKLTGDPGKAKDAKKVPAPLSLTTRAAHPRR